MYVTFCGTFCASDWWRCATEGQPVPVTETKLKSRLRQLNLREGLCWWHFIGWQERHLPHSHKGFALDDQA